ncbi:Protein of unknown function [Rhizobiales bacterium GAS113]|nr:Protein of unknown function [Rhizobiales bacterium GAS113]
MRRIRIGETELPLGAAQLSELLAKAYSAHHRPVCLCCSPNVPMYVARIGGRHILKRMPGTGPRHDPSCDSYEAPYELSGFGHVAGSAIQENVEDGVTVLKLDFSLSKTGGNSAPVPTDGTETGSVTTDGSKLSLRALLHYLWDQAEFNRWRPGMSGRRNWAVIRKFLLEAAEGKTTKGRSLLDVLYIPEMFHSEREAEITQRRIAFMNRVSATKGSRQPLLVLIGEVKDIAPARFGHRIVAKHLPKYPFMLNEDVHRRMTTRFANELSLWDAMPETHLIAIATFGIAPTGVASIETIGLMVVTENWIPFEHGYDAVLLDALTRRRASYLKGLRYNLSVGRPLASVILREDGAAPVAMYIVPPNADDAYRAALDELTNESQMATWIWAPGEADMPPLPT